MVIRHDHKNFAVSHMSCNSKHKACIGEAKKTLGAEDETQLVCATSPEKAKVEVQLNADVTGMLLGAGIPTEKRITLQCVGS